MKPTRLSSVGLLLSALGWSGTAWAAPSYLTIDVKDLTTAVAIVENQSIAAGHQFQVTVRSNGVDCAGQFAVTALGAPGNSPEVLVQRVPFVIGPATSASVTGSPLSAGALPDGTNAWNVSASCNGATFGQFAFDTFSFSVGNPSVSPIPITLSISVSDITTGLPISRGQSVAPGNQFQVTVATNGVNCAGQFIVTALGAPGLPPSVPVQFVPLSIGPPQANSATGAILTANLLAQPFGANDWKISASCNAGLGAFATATFEFVVSPIPPISGPGIIFNNLTGVATPGGYIVGQYPGFGDFTIAAAFIPGDQSFRLNQVQALLSFSSGANHMILGLFDDVGGRPGSLLESWNLMNVLGPAPAVVTLSSVTHPALVEGKSYWITAGMADPSSVGVWWINTLGQQGPTTTSLNAAPFVPSTQSVFGFNAFAVIGTPCQGADPCDGVTRLFGNFGPGATYQRDTGTAWASGDVGHSSNAVSFTNSTTTAYRLDRLHLAANWFSGSNALSVDLWEGADLNAATLLESFAFGAATAQTPAIFSAVSTRHPLIQPGGTYSVTLSVPGAPDTIWGWQWNNRGQTGYSARFGTNPWFLEPGATPAMEVLGAPTTAPCTYSLSPTDASFGAQGGLGTTVLTTTPTCGWGATTNASWIALTSGRCLVGDISRCPQGSGKINFAVAANNSPTSRSGIVSAGGQQFQVTQQGLTCAFFVTPTSVPIGSAGGTARINVATPAPCSWSASSNAAWVTAVGGGQGNGVLILTIVPNGSAARTGTVTVAGQSISITQTGAAQTPTCGSAVDVTGKVRIDRTGIIPVDPYGRLERHTIVVTNISGSVIRGPLYLVFVGLPTAQVGVVQNPSLTTCFSTKGDTIVLMTASDLQPGKNTGFLPLISKQEWWNSVQYVPKVLAGGTPALK
jgi:Putative binding domain, N-terminal